LGHRRRRGRHHPADREAFATALAVQSLNFKYLDPAQQLRFAHALPAVVEKCGTSSLTAVTRMM